MYTWYTESKRNKSKYNTQENHQITIKAGEGEKNIERNIHP